MKKAGVDLHSDLTDAGSKTKGLLYVDDIEKVLVKSFKGRLPPPLDSRLAFLLKRYEKSGRIVV